jgi:hypothetical protein
MHFAEKERLIFQYHDGVALRWADPLVVQRRLTQASGGNPNKLLDDCHSGDPLVATCAADRLVEALRVTFEMPALDPATGAGVPEQFAWDALQAFQEFVDAKKKPVASTPTCSPPTEPPSEVVLG